MPKRPMTPEDLLRIQFIGDPQISPDGSRILFAKKHINDKNKYITNLFTVNLDGAVTQWTQGELGAGNGRWSRDGSKIAFISGRDEKKSQIYVIDTSGGEARRVTSLPEGTVAGLEWSPDGSMIAFLYRATHPNWTEEAKKKREADNASIPPREVDSIWYRLDGDGYFEQQRFALYVVDVATSQHRLLLEEPKLGDIGFCWSPNSQELAVTHTVAKSPSFDPPNDQVFRVSVADGQKWMLDGPPKGSKNTPKWSPDGKSIAYLGDDSEVDPWGVKNVKLFVVPADGGEPKCLTRGDDYCLTVMGLSDTKEAYGYAALTWSPDSAALYVSIGWHGETQLGYVQVDRAKVELLTSGKHTITVGSLSDSGERFACLYGTTSKLNEVALIDLSMPLESQPTVLTKFNQEFHDELHILEPEEHWVESTDGAKVQTWVIKPLGYLEPKRYPAVLEIHGGPHAQYGYGFFHEFQVLAAAGYVVVYSNPRGSKGYGEAFAEAIRGAWGKKDWDDVQAVTRWMQHLPYVHPGKMGVMGGSYGGYMTNWVIGHTTEFAAAITDRCVSNLVSMGGNSDFPINKDQYWAGSPWGDLKTIQALWEQSPIAYFDKVETPTLIIHSEGDLRCNIEQAEQVFSALQAKGIASRFVRYPVTTSHGLSRGGPPDLRLHRLREVLAWWEKYLQ